MAVHNLYFAWCWFFMGLASGTIQGLWFHRENWLGGYDSWPRRLTRLGHIAFFGTGLLNLCFAFTVLLLGVEGQLVRWASPLLILGAVSMSTVCYLCAWRKPLRHLFFIPVVSLLVGVGLMAAALLVSERIPS
jgi:hypothetical protein